MNKFRFVDAKGKPLDFLKTSRRRLQKALHANLDNKHSMPADNALRYIEEYLLSPTPEEEEMHQSWDRTLRSRRDDKAIEQLCRQAAGWLPIAQRPKGRGTEKNRYFGNLSIEYPSNSPFVSMLAK